MSLIAHRSLWRCRKCGAVEWVEGDGADCQHDFEANYEEVVCVVVPAADHEGAALREAHWDISTLQTERDAAIQSALMPFREALKFVADAENIIAARECADRALRRVDGEDWREAF